MWDWIEHPGRDDNCIRLAEYFGSEYAFYGAWIDFYTSWLFVPAVLGLVLWWFDTSSGLGRSAFVYAFFMPIWATLFLEFWYA